MTFLIVACIMLHTGSDSIALQSLDIWNSKFSGKVRVFTHILEISSAQRTPVHIHSRAKYNILFTETRLFSQSLSILTGNLPVPSSCKACQGRESHTRVVVPARIAPVVPWNFRTYAMRSVTGPQFRNSQLLHSRKGECRLSMYGSYLLIQCHTAQSILNPCLNICRRVKINWSI